MKSTKKIAVINGTGKSGQYLLKQLINQGFQIKVLVRNPKKIPEQNPLAEIIIGDVRDYEVVREFIDRCQAVISALGTGIPPSGPTIFSLATKNIIRAMNECHVQRYIALTGLNVDDPFDKKSFKTDIEISAYYSNCLHRYGIHFSLFSGRLPSTACRNFRRTGN